VYKALYRLFGGFVADVVAAIDQVCKSTSQTSYALVGSLALDEKL
jgi:hypothetical protein